MKKIAALLLLLLLSAPAVAEVHKIDRSDDQARYLIQVDAGSFFVHYAGYFVTGSGSGDKAVRKRSFDLCRRLGFAWYRFAELVEIADDDKLRGVWELSGALPSVNKRSRRDSKIVVFSQEKQDHPVRTCRTVKEQRGVLLAERKAERKAAKAERRGKRHP